MASIKLINGSFYLSNGDVFDENEIEKETRRSIYFNRLGDRYRYDKRTSNMHNLTTGDCYYVEAAKLYVVKCWYLDKNGIKHSGTSSVCDRLNACIRGGDLAIYFERCGLIDGKTFKVWSEQVK